MTSVRTEIDRWGFPAFARAVTVTNGPAPAPKVQRRQLGRGSYIDAQILPALRKLSDVQSPKPMSGREIARACGVDHETIRLIEQAALRKLRARLSARLSRSEIEHAAQLLGCEVFSKL